MDSVAQSEFPHNTVCAYSRAGDPTDRGGVVMRMTASDIHRPRKETLRDNCCEEWELGTLVEVGT